MSLQLTTVFVVLVTSGFCSCGTTANRAIPLITVKENNDNSEDQFLLNPDVISMIKQLSSPVKVIAAIGDARVGKSTALNFIHRSLSDSDQHESEEEIFPTGNTMEAVTHGVWISTVRIHGKNGMENLVLLDVEGTDLGDDSVTDKLGVFVTLMSSSLMLFTKEHPTNHITDYLYKIARVSDMAFGKEDIKYFPHLIVTLRGALHPPQGYSNIDDYVKDSLIKLTWDDNSKANEKKKVIKRHFCNKDQLTVINLPFDPVLSDGYRERIESLKEKLIKLPPKRISEERLDSTLKIFVAKAHKYWEGQTDEGLVINGQMFVDLAERLVKMINDEHRSNERINHNFYHLFENEICSRSFNKYVKPLILDTTNHDKTQTNMISQFKKHCALKQRLNIAVDILGHCSKKTDQSYLDSLIWYIKTLGCLSIVVLATKYLLPLLSDVQLKENIVLVTNSEYETIGLRGVKWVWNKKAERLGLSGRGSGVVAQDVELLYPWAVTEGYDGYKRVNYFALQSLIFAKKFKSLKLLV